MNKHSKQVKNSQSGAVLLLSLLVLVFLTILLGAAMLRSNVQVTEVMQRRSLQEAFYAAEGGLDRAVYELRQNSAWKPGFDGQNPIVDEPLTIVNGTSTVTIGYYSLTVEDGGQYLGWDTRWVTSQGRDTAQTVKRTIKSRVIVQNPSRFLISTLGTLKITSGADLKADILAQDINFAVNPSLKPPENQIHVDGDVFYINSITNNHDSAIIYGADSQTQQSPSITFAGVDVNRYKALATNLQTQNAGLSYNGNLTVDLSNLASLSNNGKSFVPQLIFATGDIHISGQYDHSLAIVAGGNIYIDGNIVPNNSTDSNRPQIGLFSKGDVLIPSSVRTNDDTLDVEAFVLADGLATGSAGTFKALGEKFSKGSLNFTGAISVRGNNTNAVDLNVFKNRAYNFNPDLNTHRTIPFTPIIVNVIQWQEI